MSDESSGRGLAWVLLAMMLWPILVAAACWPEPVVVVRSVADVERHVAEMRELLCSGLHSELAY